MYIRLVHTAMYFRIHRIYRVHCTFITSSKMYIVQCMMYILQYMMYIVHCKCYLSMLRLMSKVLLKINGIFEWYAPH